MELLPLILFAPLALIVAGLVGFGLKWLKLLPAGVGPFLASGMLWAVVTGGFFAESYAEEMVIRPWRYQAEHLGGHYGTPLNMRRYTYFGFQDFVFETTYQLSVADAAKLRTRCGKPTQAFGLSGCELYSWQGGEYSDKSMVIMLSADNKLHIVELA